jgi:ribosomal protein L21
VIVFKKKKRKGYRKTQGHRQNLAEVRIDAIEA